MTANIFSSLNLAYNPFSLATSRQGFYQTESTRLILDEFVHGVETGKGFMVLLGEVGVGKTSLSLQLFAALEDRKVDFAWIFNTVFTKEELYRAIVDDFGLKDNQGETLLDYQKRLQRFFLEQYDQGKTSLIVVDEAHNLSDESLESLRMLSNLENAGQKLVQIILIGQPELGIKLDQTGMRQLRSRVAILKTLPPLTKEELGGYVNFKLAEAGSQIRLEGRPLTLLWDVTHGNLRRAKLVMERVLYGCVAYGSNVITPKIIRAAIAEVLDASGSSTAHRRYGFGLAFAMGGFVTIVVLAILCMIPFWKAGPRSYSAMDVAFERIRAFSLDKSGETNSSVSPIWGNTDSLSNKQVEELETFLGSSISNSLQEAVRLRFPGLISRDLPKDVVLFEMETLPAEPGTSGEWTAFFWRRFVQKGPAWLVFWRPGPLLGDIYLGAHGPHIVRLQKLLKSRGVFPEKPDGVFGKSTWYALADFQRRNGLRATGQPTPLTLFVLRFAG